MKRLALFIVLLLCSAACQRSAKPLTFQNHLETLAQEARQQGRVLERQLIQQFLEQRLAPALAGYAQAQAYLTCPTNLPKQPVDAILYFSFTLNDSGALSVTSQQRLREVERVYKMGLAKNIILTGGAGRRPLESKIARAQLVANGVPAAAIWLEEKSVNTWQNLTYGLELALQHDFRSIHLVSSPYHLPRILRYAERLQAERGWAFEWSWSAYDPDLDPIDLKHERLEDRDDQILKEIYALLRDHFQYQHSLNSCNKFNK